MISGRGSKIVGSAFSSRALCRQLAFPLGLKKSTESDHCTSASSVNAPAGTCVLPDGVLRPNRSQRRRGWNAPRSVAHSGSLSPPVGNSKCRRSFHGSGCACGEDRQTVPDEGGLTADGVILNQDDSYRSVATSSCSDDGDVVASLLADVGIKSFTDVPGATTGKGKKLVMLFTCKVCETRSAKQFTENAYRNGVVMVRCPGCENLHLIADRLGMFEDRGEDGKGWDVEGALAKAGENVVAKTGEDVLELTMADILGKKT